MALTPSQRQKLYRGDYQMKQYLGWILRLKSNLCQKQEQKFAVQVRK